jgi:hypothetical protein
MLLPHASIVEEGQSFLEACTGTARVRASNRMPSAAAVAAFRLMQAHLD